MDHAHRTLYHRPCFRFDQRASGILLHPTSLPGPHGSGDVGPEAHTFIDFLSGAGQRWWQMLPVGPPSAPPGNGPYGSCSAFAGSIWLISPERLLEDGLLKAGDFRRPPRFPVHRVDYRAANRHRLRLLRRAFENVRGDRTLAQSIAAYRAENRGWLEDFALYCALKSRHDDRCWSQWPVAMRDRDPAALDQARSELAETLGFHVFCQYLFDQQWKRFRAYANAHGVGLIGDIPIFVSYDSADVWSHRALFMLNRNGRPQCVTGVPPDEYCRDGQLWRHPHYRWAAHQQSGFAWWVERFRSMMSRFDGVRIDHFLGFNRAWSVSPRAKTARRGTWLAGPGEALFGAVKRKLGDLPIIAEDLGILTPEAAALRDRCRFPGMRVMQFGFTEGGDYHLPHQYNRRCVAYTGTHDNDTITGWFDDLIRRNGHPGSSQSLERERAMHYLEVSRGDQVPWGMIQAAMSSVADTVILQLQDLLNLGSTARMNIPGTCDDNWRWRLAPGALTPEIARNLRELTQGTRRLVPTTATTLADERPRLEVHLGGKRKRKTSSKRSDHARSLC